MKNLLTFFLAILFVLGIFTLGIFLIIVKFNEPVYQEDTNNRTPKVVLELFLSDCNKSDYQAAASRWTKESIDRIGNFKDYCDSFRGLNLQFGDARYGKYETDTKRSRLRRYNHRTGIVESKLNFLGGNLHGVVKTYYQNGALLYKDTYKNGEKINRKAYDSEGRLKFSQDY